MVEFELSEEQRLMIDTVNSFASSQLREKMRDFEYAEEVSEDVKKAFFELGLSLMDIPAELGGQGLKLIDRILVTEELAWGDPGAARALLSSLPAAYFIEALSTPEQAKELLSPLGAPDGYKHIIACAIEEEFDVVDPSSMSTVARSQGDKFVLSGKKYMVDFADEAEKIIISAVEEGKSGWEAVRFFIVDNSDAIKKTKEADKLGLRSHHTYHIEFENLEVPAEALLAGGEDLEKAFKKALTKWRLVLCALSVGASRAAFEYAAQYSKERTAFGQPISQFQAIAFMIADMATLIDSARLLVWKAAVDVDKGEDAAESSALACLQVMEAGFFATSNSVQILGGHGFIQDHPVEKWMRDVRTISNYLGLPHELVMQAGREILQV